MSVSAPTTKERILEAAEEIMLQKSFHSVGLNEILTAVKVPKGSFYHYFQSKEHFGVELLKHYVAEASAWKRRLLLSTDQEPNPLERFLTYMESNIARMFEGECRGSCLVAKLATEISSFSDPMRQVLADGMRDWQNIIEKLLVEALEKKAIRANLDPVETAALIQDLWMGASQRSQVQRNVAPLRGAVTFLRRYLTP
jgi:TetR/AcrR family transcriptional regulator, transcriptional repressor for nem operon